jgi:glutamine amidotransferase
MIYIIDYGLGNLGSIQNMIKRVGGESKIIDNPNQLTNPTKIILPGVGAFDTGMKKLNENNWISVLNNEVLVNKIPALGICLGMQLMTNSSEEGNLKGLGWIDANVKKFIFDNNSYKIPHMGWNKVKVAKDSYLFDSTESNKFYFVHSYYVETNNPSDNLLYSNYGNEFVSAFQKENIIGLQFHPEKSHKFGINLFKKFINQY